MRLSHRESSGQGNTPRQGAPGRSRTCDLSLRRRLLYPLSYWGAPATILSRVQGLRLMARDPGAFVPPPVGDTIWRPTAGAGGAWGRLRPIDPTRAPGDAGRRVSTRRPGRIRPRRARPAGAVVARKRRAGQGAAHRRAGAARHRARPRPGHRAVRGVPVAPPQREPQRDGRDEPAGQPAGQGGGRGPPGTAQHAGDGLGHPRGRGQQHRRADRWRRPVRHDDHVPPLGGPETAYGISIPRDTLVDRPECYDATGRPSPAVPT